MSRPPRMAFPRALSPVISRGNAHFALSRAADDRPRFLKTLQDVVTRSQWRYHAYDLLDHHDHLRLDTPEGPLPAGMRHVQGKEIGVRSCNAA